jgi:hypothetical protein
LKVPPEWGKKIEKQGYALVFLFSSSLPGENALLDLKKFFFFKVEKGW